MTWMESKNNLGESTEPDVDEGTTPPSDDEEPVADWPDEDDPNEQETL